MDIHTSRRYQISTSQSELRKFIFLRSSQVNVLTSIRKISFLFKPKLQALWNGELLPSLLAVSHADDALTYDGKFQVFDLN